jgi:hypothetical protein
MFRTLDKGGVIDMEGSSFDRMTDHVVPLLSEASLIVARERPQYRRQRPRSFGIRAKYLLIVDRRSRAKAARGDLEAAWNENRSSSR